MQTTHQTEAAPVQVRGEKDNGLADMVKNIADTINSGNYEPSEEGGCSAFDYLQDALDFQWITTNDLQFLGARVLVAFGGPNVWIDTHRKIVEGFWWGDYAKAEIYEDPMGLNDALEDLYLSRLDEAKMRK